MAAVPAKCTVRSGVTSFPVQALKARWHIVYTQPDAVEHFFSKGCYCNTGMLLYLDSSVRWLI